MIAAAMSTIPERKDSFAHVVDAILHRQTRPIDRLDVFLHRYEEAGADLPRDNRLWYHLEPRGAGSWARYLYAQELADDDVFVTLDDDTIYPIDYIERGVSELEGAGQRTAVSFGGLLWDPLTTHHTYGSASWRFLASNALDWPQNVAFLQGLVSFFWVWMVKGAIDRALPGFDTNDDMMISLALQRRGVRILCLTKREQWIRDFDSASAGHALWVRDVSTRYKVFESMVKRLGFDPAAGALERIRQCERRILVLAGSAPPQTGTGPLDDALVGLCGTGTSVHLLARVGQPEIGKVMIGTNRPYWVHAVSVPATGGRLDGLLPIRAWRNSRVAWARRSIWNRRASEALNLLRPSHVMAFEEGRLRDLRDNDSRVAWLPGAGLRPRRP